MTRDDHSPPAGDDAVFAGEPSTPARRLARECLAAGVRAAQPARAVTDRVRVTDDRLRVTGDDRTVTVDLTAFDRLLVVGGGKAAAGLTQALVADLIAAGHPPDDGIVLVPAETADSDRREPTGQVRLAPGGHPTPTAEGVAATREALGRVDDAGRETLVLAPITGGGSALLAAPAPSVDRETVTAVTAELLAAGATVRETNAVRAALSAVKAGRLAARAAPARVLGVVVSDVVGDDPAVVASGPTVPPPPDRPDPLAVLDRHDVTAPAARAAIRDGDPPPPPAPDGAVAARTDTVVLAGGRRATAAAVAHARERGARATALGEETGEARRRGRRAGALAAGLTLADEPVVLVTGGETTVTVTGDGVGGPNCEYALAAGLELAGHAADRETVVAAVDTDGRDGSTTAAGGIVDGETVTDPGAARAALDGDDSLPFLADADCLLRAGPTGTNVNDLRVVVRLPASG